MAFKPRHRYVSWPGMNFKGNWLEGTVWWIQGKSEPYSVTMEPKGFSCSCPGFTFHGKCRHIARVGMALTGQKSLHAHGTPMVAMNPS